MNPTMTLLLSILIFMSILEIILIQLNITTLDQPLDPLVKDIYDRQGYEKFKTYTLVNSRFKIGSKMISLVLNIIFFLWIAPLISSLLQTNTTILMLYDVNNILLYNILFLVIVLTLQSIINLPIEWLNQLMIEIPFGFSNTTFKLWVQDKIKGALLFLVIGLPLISGLLYLILTSPTSFLLTAWLGALAFIIITQILYVPVLIPLFNKLSPLEEGPLKNKIQEVAKKANYEVKQISMMNASKRSNRLNAFFTGFGKFKHIILFDTLLSKLNDDQITSVLAHEIGHAKHKDVLKLLLINALNLFMILGLFQWLLTILDISTTFNVNENTLIFKLMVFFVLIEPLQLLLSIITSRFSRSMEYKADQMMVSLGYKKAAVEAFKILGKTNFVHLNPHPLVVELTYSHSPIKERLQAILK
ncbi:MAG: M48 family metallopeptidase [Erysipelotrichia bacterium]|jgi:STE24 endopeptidase|nr:M48 family metallopeptidase [Erysipelotrichia bacterium]